MAHMGNHGEFIFLPAPPYFYEYLYREIAAIERGGKLQSSIKILIRPIRDFSQYDKKKIAEREISIINFAKELNRSIRQSDLAPRIGRYEFVIAFDSDCHEPDLLVERDLMIWRDEDYSFSYFSTRLTKDHDAAAENQ
jgi:GGDEF domain-containing protein